MKIDIKELARPEVAKIKPYKGEKDNQEYRMNLSGNESPYDLPLDIKKEVAEQIIENNLNYYPKLYSESLRCKISEYLDYNIDCNQVIVGNGSDEVLSMLIDTFINPGDNVLAAAPTFSMYQFFTELAGGNYHNFLLANNEFNYQSMIDKINDIDPKIIFLCSPNNPTGELLSKEVILKLIDNYSGILVIDEAYAEFSGFSFLEYVNKHNNLVVTRTFSKAFGLASIRLGYLIGNKDLVQEVAKVVKPYNINSITSLIGKTILRESNVIEQRVNKIVKERKKLYDELIKYDSWNVFPSSANFIYIEGSKTTQFKEMLNNEGIKIRSFDSKPPAIRITVGKEEDNKEVISIFKKFKEGNKSE